MKEIFSEWLNETKTNIKRPDKYYNTITTISNHFKNILAQDINIYEMKTASEVLALKEEYFSYDMFFEKNETGNRMYSRSLDLYIEFLESHNNIINYSTNEVEKIKNDKNLGIKERETIILSRIGQGKYRSDLINLWKGCAISGFNDHRFLIASHIKPWKKSTNYEKVDKYNGLLLLPTYDKLFDLGFISFYDNGKIIISKFLKNYQALGISKDIIIDVKNENKKYLKYHREYILKDKIKKLVTKTVDENQTLNIELFNSDKSEVMYHLKDITNSGSLVDKVFDFIQKHNELLDHNEYVNIDVDIPNHKLPEGFYGMMVMNKKYSVNIKKSTIVLLAFLLDIKFSKSLASLSLNLIGFSSQVIEKINEEEKCLIMDILLKKKKDIVEFNYHKKECVQNDIPCTFRDEYYCTRTIDEIMNQFNRLISKKIIVKKDGYIKQAF